MECVSMPPASVQPTDEKPSFEERISAVVKRFDGAKSAVDADKGSKEPSGPPPPNPQEGGELQASGLAVELYNLVDAAARIAQLDSLTASAATATPADNAEAKKWQEISMNAMKLSRATLEEQQKRCIVRLNAVAGRYASKDGSNSSCPGLFAASAPAPSPMPPRAVPAAPALTGAGAPLIDTASAKKQEQQKQDNMSSDTLRTHLAALQQQEPMSVIIVRRINRLGFQSSDLLKEYFAQFGDVREVLVAHSRVKPSVKRTVARVRPAGIGFVVMASKEDADAALSKDPHFVNGVNVQVQRYEVRATKEDGEEGCSLEAQDAAGEDAEDDNQ